METVTQQVGHTELELCTLHLFIHDLVFVVVTADVIMDMLGDETMRQVISSHYEDCGEHGSVKNAIKALSSKEQVDHGDSDENTELRYTSLPILLSH